MKEVHLIIFLSEMHLIFKTFIVFTPWSYVKLKGVENRVGNKS